MKIFLDDFRNPEDCLKYMWKRIGEDQVIYADQDWIVARNYPDFLDVLKSAEFEHIEAISFDHDLADSHYWDKRINVDRVQYYNNPDFLEDYNKTGYHAAQYLIDYIMDNNYNLPYCLVHSMNPVGAENIQKLLNNYVQSR